MPVTSEQIAQIRRMINEPTDAGGYTSTVITDLIETHPMTDAEGNAPVDDDWIETYDLNGAAAQAWSEKAAVLQQDYDINADGADHKRSQSYDNALRLSSFYKSRSSIKSIKIIGR